MDIRLRFGFPFLIKNYNLRILDISNSDASGQFGEVDIDPNYVKAFFFPAGTNQKVFESPTLFLNPNSFYIIYAIGSIGGGTFTLFVQEI